jgi:hypothetical protein
MKTIKRLILLSLSLLLSTGFLHAQISTNNPPVITKGLIGLWHLDGNAIDSSGNGRNGTIVGATASTGRFGPGYTFNGSSYIDVGDVDLSSQQFSVNGWIRTDRAGIVADWRMWISKMDSQSGGSFELYLGDGRAIGGGGDGPAFASLNGGQAVYVLAPNTPNVRDGNWHMITVTFQLGKQTLYCDGEELISSTGTDPLPQNNAHVRIGGMDGWGPYHHPWIGDVDEVALYNRALTASEVAKLAGITIAAPQKLVISPNSSTFVSTETYDLTFILENVTQNVISETILLDGVDRTSDFMTGAVQGNIKNGKFYMTGSPVLTAGKHTLAATFNLQDGTSVSSTEIYRVIATKP